MMKEMFDSLLGLGIFLFFKTSRFAQVSTQFPFEWLLGALSPGIKQA
jgi:hypothetical protein